MGGIRTHNRCVLSDSAPEPKLRLRLLYLVELPPAIRSYSSVRPKCRNKMFLHCRLRNWSFMRWSHPKLAQMMVKMFVH